MEQTLEELKMAKEYELNIKAEDDFWAATNDPDLFPMMSLFRSLIVAATGQRKLAQVELAKLEQTYNVTEKLKTKKQALRAATTAEQVLAITW